MCDEVLPPGMISPAKYRMRYGSCLAPHSLQRGVIISTPRQQGADVGDARTGSPCWSWARLRYVYGALLGMSSREINALAAEGVI